MGALFSTHRRIRWILPDVKRRPDPFSIDELANAIEKLNSRGAPGPDGIPVEVVRMADRVHPDQVLAVLNAALDTGEFPRIWKRARLVLLPKGDKPPDEPSAYRPICLLHVMGKVLEHLIRSRLRQEMEDEGGLSELQFGFRQGRSTLDAINLVVDTAREAMGGSRKTRRLCALVTLDIRTPSTPLRGARWWKP